jgi:hypothetical protein
LSPRVATGTAPLPALAASVGAEGESKKSDLSVLHLDRRLEIRVLGVNGIDQRERM